MAENSEKAAVKAENEVLFLTIIEPPEVNRSHGKTQNEAIRTITFQEMLAGENAATQDRLDNTVPLDMNPPKNIFKDGEEALPYQITQVRDQQGNIVLEKTVFVTDFIESDMPKGSQERDPTQMGRVFEAFRLKGYQQFGDQLEQKIAAMRGKERGSLDPYDPQKQLEILRDIARDAIKLGNIGRKLLESDTKPIDNIPNDDTAQEAGREKIQALIQTVERIAEQYQGLEAKGLQKTMLHGDAWFDNYERQRLPKGVSYTAKSKDELLVGSTEGNKRIKDSERAGKLIPLDLDDIGFGYRLMDIATTVSSVGGVDIKTGKLNAKGKEVIRGSDEIAPIADIRDADFYTCLANAASYIAVMRIDKYAHERYTGRDPQGEIEKAKLFADAATKQLSLGLNPAVDLTPITEEAFREGARQGSWQKRLAEPYNNSQDSVRDR